MNTWIGMGRLTKDPDVRYTQTGMAMARFTLAVDRRGAKAGEEQQADFISCVAFDKRADFVSKYLSKGTKVVTEGHIQTGSYTNKEGQKVYTTDIMIDQIEFAESKASQEQKAQQQAYNAQQNMTGYYQQQAQQQVPYSAPQYAAQPPQYAAPQYGNYSQAPGYAPAIPQEAVNQGFMPITEGVDSAALPFNG